MRRFSPLRICAIVVLIAAALAAVWLALGMPGHPGWHDEMQDPFYLVAARRHFLPFPAAGAGISGVVALAAGTAMARVRRGAAGLWMVLAGTAIILLLMSAEFVSQTARHEPMRYDELAAQVERSRFIYLAMSGSAVLLLAGILLWLSARFARRPRDAA